MDASALVWNWFLLTTLWSVIGSTSSVSITQDLVTKSTMATKRAVPSDTIGSFVYTSLIDNPNNFKPMVRSKKRFYRQADLETITSTDVTTTEGFELTDKNSTEATTESTMITDKTVIPLTSTVSPDSSDSNLRESSETDKLIPVMTMNTPDHLDESEVLLNGNPIEVSDLSTANKKDTIVSSNFNGIESESTSNEPLGLSDKFKSNESSDQLEVIGIPERTKRTEIIMKLQPSKAEEYKWLKETIHSMLEDTILKKETDNYVTLLNQRYHNLPVNEADNKIWTKYSRAIVESFVLEFCRNSPHYTTSEQWTARSYNEEEYNSIFNTTLLNLQQKRNYTAIQFAAPVRRAADIYKAILDTPIGIVQSKCVAGMPRWMCFAEYVVHLADTFEQCEHIWYHAQVHLVVLQSMRHAKGARDPAHQVIAEVDSRLAVDSKNDVDFLFDLIISTLRDLREKLKESLYLEANLYGLIRKLQSEDKLNCLNLEQE